MEILEDALTRLVDELVGFDDDDITDYLRNDIQHIYEDMEAIANLPTE